MSRVLNYEDKYDKQDADGKWLITWGYGDGTFWHLHHTLSGSRWRDVLKRCNPNSVYCKKNPIYIGTHNGFKDFQEFAEWSMSEYGYNLASVAASGKPRMWQIEKDLLSGSSKTYSPETCLYVPPEVNLYTTCKKRFLKQTPLGVKIDSRNGRFIARLTQCGTETHLGVFDDMYEAHRAWQKAKIVHGRNLCDKYKEHEKMVAALSSNVDKIENDLMTGKETSY